MDGMAEPFNDLGSDDEADAQLQAAEAAASEALKTAERLRQQALAEKKRVREEKERQQAEKRARQEEKVRQRDEEDRQTAMPTQQPRRPLTYVLMDHVNDCKTDEERVRPLACMLAPALFETLKCIVSHSGF